MLNIDIKNDSKPIILIQILVYQEIVKLNQLLKHLITKTIKQFFIMFYLIRSKNGLHSRKKTPF